jgi:Opioid growth factor receptor (OGFr) conserved region
MLRFYGLESVKAEDGSISIQKAIEFPERSQYWLTPNNHNHLRLTRMIDSTRLLGLETIREACLEFFKKLPSIIQTRFLPGPLSFGEVQPGAQFLKHLRWGLG